MASDQTAEDREKEEGKYLDEELEVADAELPYNCGEEIDHSVLPSLKESADANPREHAARRRAQRFVFGKGAQNGEKWLRKQSQGFPHLRVFALFMGFFCFFDGKQFSISFHLLSIFACFMFFMSLFFHNFSVPFFSFSIFQFLSCFEKMFFHFFYILSFSMYFSFSSRKKHKKKNGFTPEFCTSFLSWVFCTSKLQSFDFRDRPPIEASFGKNPSGQRPFVSWCSFLHGHLHGSGYCKTDRSSTKHDCKNWPSLMTWRQDCQDVSRTPLLSIAELACEPSATASRL